MIFIQSLKCVFMGINVATCSISGEIHLQVCGFCIQSVFILFLFYAIFATSKACMKACYGVNIYMSLNNLINYI